MQFRDLGKQYQNLKKEIDKAVLDVMATSKYIAGPQVKQLETQLAEYVGVKYCITCANGTDALYLALKTWGIGSSDAVFVPDFTYFASAEVIAMVGAVPVFVDVDPETYNMDPDCLEKAIAEVENIGELRPRSVIAVDLFGLPADYSKISEICKKYNLLLLEDGAQGFGGNIRGKRACSFGDIATTSFFPAKPLGCYGDGGALFTDNDDWAEIIRSYAVHGKGKDKYDNIRIGMNSRLDTLQAAILQVKFNAFQEYELLKVNEVADRYHSLLRDTGLVLPLIPDGFYSSWAQYTVQLPEQVNRDSFQKMLMNENIPTMLYYERPLHVQHAFDNYSHYMFGCKETEKLCNNVVSLPIDPYKEPWEIEKIVETIIEVLKCKD